MHFVDHLARIHQFADGSTKRSKGKGHEDSDGSEEDSRHKKKKSSSKKSSSKVFNCLLFCISKPIEWTQISQDFTRTFSRNKHATAMRDTMLSESRPCLAFHVFVQVVCVMCVCVCVCVCVYVCVCVCVCLVHWFPSHCVCGCVGVCVTQKGA